jgi:catechol 2,3-dioxygenase-like lactoylglutathione lyase family enzyme
MSAIAKLALVVRDYDEAIEWYSHCLGFELVEDTKLSATKRWVVMRPPGKDGAALLLARADGPEQEVAIGRQAGGRVFLFLETNNFDGDFKRMTKAGVLFRELPRREPYGDVAVFEDLYGNAWDLIQPAQ